MDVIKWARPLFVDDVGRYVVFKGGRGRGATYALAQWHILRMMAGESVVLLREYQNSIMDSNMGLMRQVVKDSGLEKHFDLGGKYEIRSRQGGRCVAKGMARNPDSVRSLTGYQRAWIEEGADVSQHTLDVLLPSLREDGQTVCVSYNPQHEGDPIEDFVASVGSDGLVVHADYRDNRWFPRALDVERKRSERTDSQELYKHIWLGDYRPATATNPFGRELIDGAFRRERDVGEWRIAGVDLAWTDTPTSDYTGIVVLDEYGTEVRVEQFREEDQGRLAERVYEGVKDCAYVAVDSAGPGRSVVSHLEEMGVRAQGVAFTAPKKEAWVHDVRRRLSEERLALRDGRLRKEMLAYGGDKGRFEAVTGHDDLVSALLLACETLRRAGV